MKKDFIILIVFVSLNIQNQAQPVTHKYGNTANVLSINTSDIVKKKSKSTIAPNYLVDSTYKYRFKSLVDSTQVGKIIDKYDTNGRITLSILYNWDEYTNKWVGSCKTKITGQY